MSKHRRARRTLSKAKFQLGEAVQLPGTFMCPHCGYDADGASGVGNDGGPSLGDMAICINCASILVYQDKTLRVATEEEMNRLEPEEQAKVAVAVLAVKLIPPHARPKKGSVH